MIRILLLLLTFVFHTFVTADEEDIERLCKNLENTEENTYLIDLQGMPTSIVAGCVNAITGNYNEGNRDLLVPGANPVPLIRSYNSSKQDEGTLQFGWDINLPGKVRLAYGDVRQNAIVSHGGSGYWFDGRSKVELIKLDKSTYKHGVTNAHNGQLTAREKLKNTKFFYIKGNRHCELRLNKNEYVEFKAKGIRDGTNVSFRLNKHYFPNRCIFDYAYKSGRLKKVSSIGSQGQNLGSLNFIYPHKFSKDPQLTIETEDGRSVQYRFKKERKDYYFLSEVIASHLPHQTYSYTYDANAKQIKLAYKRLPDSRFLGLEYNDKGTQEIHGQEFTIDSKKDTRYGRVRTLKSPVGTDASEVITHSFVYHLKYDYHSRKTSEGHTQVFDAYGNKTVYDYSNEHRLREVQNYLSDGQLYRKEIITWGKDGSDYTLLKQRQLLDAKENMWLERSYTYDKRGNSIKETMRGDLVGQGSFDEYVKTFTYTFADQLASENDGRKETRYTYYPKTDLIKSKYIIVNSEIKERVFFEYDANGSLTLEIIDDGNDSSKENLSRVTERRIKRIQTNTTQPIGLPKIIDELCLEMDTGNEIPLRRTVNDYSVEGNILHQSVYDCHENHAYTKSWTYNSMGKVISETDSMGQTSFYDYDANGNCIRKQIENTDFYISYVYDFSNRLIREEEVYNDGLRLALTYSYDLKGNKIASSDIYGNITRYVYDEFNRQIEVIHPPIITPDGCESIPSEKITYDVLNNITSRTDGNGFKTQIYCTAHCKPWMIEYPDGTTERSYYNTDGTLRKVFLPNGAYILYEYDYQQRNTSEENYSPEGTLLSRETKTYNAFHLTSETDKKGIVTTFKYDSFGRLISGKTGSKETRFMYDALGRQSEVWELAEEGYYKKTISEFDMLDRVIEERVEDSLGKVFSKKGTSYDSLGNKTRESVFSSQGKTAKITEYNGQGHPVKIIHPNGEITHLYHSFCYLNEYGHPVAYQESVDPKGNRIVYVNNTNEKLASEEYYSPTGVLIKKLSYRYDLAGNLVTRLEDIIVDDEVVDVVITALEYDARNRETRIIKAYGRPEQKIFRKEYTHFEKIKSQNKPDGVVLNYTYDYLGRLMEVRDNFDSLHYAYTYDLNDNVLSVTDKITQTITTREFNSDDHLVKETQDNGLTLEYRHDRLGRIECLTLPDRSKILYEYDASNLRSISRDTGSETFTQTYSYDLSGRPSLVTLPQENGTISYQYDHALRLKSVQSTFFSQVIPENGYDQNNNIVAIDQTDPVGASSSNYAYDPLNQLISEEGIAKHSYDYDSRHNRIKKDETTYENDILSQLVSQGNTLYGYDPNGNRRSVKRTHHVLDCEYDAMDRLISVTKGECQTKYTYDAFNRRMSKAVFSLENGQWKKSFEERYLYSSETEIGSVSPEGKICELMLAAGSRPAMLEIDSVVYLPIQDHRGNIVTLLDAKRHQIMETYRYSAFGEEEIFDAQGLKKESALSPWRFSGKRVDAETGWVFFGRRYYDPEVGRWTTTDPMWFEDGPNLYAYVQNNPIIFVDPNGLKHRGVDCGNSQQNHRSFSHYEKIANVFRLLTGPFGMFANFTESRSSTYCIEGTKSRKIAIVFVNGIWNSKKASMDSAKIVSDMAGGCHVRGLYNCSYGLLDLVECFFGLKRIDTDPVQMLLDLWEEEFAKLDKDGILLQIAHSQGCIIVRNALERLDPELRKRIRLIAVCPGAYTSLDICGSVSHLVSNWDFVPLIDYTGREICRNTIVFLKSDPTASYFDHAFSSKTFEKEMRYEISNIMRTYGARISFEE